jgi:hypothetical protein
LPAWLYTFLTVLFLVHGVVFLRVWRRTRKWRHACLVGTFATLTIIYGLKWCGLIGPCQLSANPEMALRGTAVGFSVAAVTGYVRERRHKG